MKTFRASKLLLCSLLALFSLLASSAALAQSCTREYAPVCGRVAGETTPKMFSNRCMLDAAKATPLAEAECTAKPLPGTTPVVVGGDVDAHGCKPSTGYVWNEELGACLRPWMSSAVTLEVAAKRRKCTGVMEMQCLMVRELEPGKPQKKWEPLYADIAGFEPVPGVRYTVRVRKDRLDDVPADAPAVSYTLLKVLPR